MFKWLLKPLVVLVETLLIALALLFLAEYFGWHVVREAGGVVGASAATTVINRESGLHTPEVGSGHAPLVLLHGYGSSPQEWRPFTQTIRVSAQTRFIFPEAPGTTLPPDGPEGGRGWWRLDLASYCRPGESIPDLSAARPTGLDESAGRIQILLNEIRRRLRPGSTEAILGGFSQGAMIAADIAFRTDVPLRALVILSGTIVDERTWTKGMPQRKALPVLLHTARGHDSQVRRRDAARAADATRRAAGHVGSVRRRP
jgi:phospholipase/carboxylesterase